MLHWRGERRTIATTTMTTTTMHSALLNLWDVSYQKRRHQRPCVSGIWTITECIRDLNKLNLIWRFDIRLGPIFATAPAASKNTTYFKNDSEIVTSLVLPRLSLNPWYTLFYLAEERLFITLLWMEWLMSVIPKPFWVSSRVNFTNILCNAQSWQKMSNHLKPVNQFHHLIFSDKFTS